MVKKINNAAPRGRLARKLEFERKQRALNQKDDILIKINALLKDRTRNISVLKAAELVADGMDLSVAQVRGIYRRMQQNGGRVIFFLVFFLARVI